MDNILLEDHFFNKKLACGQQKFTVDNLDEPSNLSKDDYYSNVTQFRSNDEFIHRRETILKSIINIKAAINLTLLYFNMKYEY